MADIKSLQTSIPSPSGAKPQPQRGYKDVGEVVRRAGVMGDELSPQTQAALKRLDKVLASEEPLKTDVPRGYYLNIQV